MKLIHKEHWEDLYARLHDAYVECMTHNNTTYETHLAQLLGRMITDRKEQNIYIR